MTGGTSGRDRAARRTEATRGRLVEAATIVLRTCGLARTTTKQISEQAGVAEGTLYVHFPDKLALLDAVLDQELPSFTEAMRQLGDLVGRSAVQRNLELIGEAALSFFSEVVPTGAAIFAEPELLARRRETFRAADRGPQRPIRVVADYLRSEQRLARVRRTADPDVAAMLLLGPLAHHALIAPLVGDDSLPVGREVLVRRVVRQLMPGLAPPPRSAPLRPSADAAAGAR